MPREVAAPSLADWILALVALAGGRLRGKTRLHKGLFIARMEAGDLVPAEFKPHNYGPWSPSIEEELGRLAREGLVEIRYEPTNGEAPREVIELTPRGLERAREALRRIQATPAWRDLKYKLEFAAKAPLLELLWYVYEFWPEYTENSLIRGRLRFLRRRRLGIRE